MNSRDAEALTIPPDGRPEADQPRWRQDFPIDVPQDEYIARRDFTKFMLLTSLAFAVGQWWILARRFFRRSSGQLPVKEIARADEIRIGQAVVFDYPEAHQPAVLVRIDENQFVAYDQQCTHLSCPVIPRINEKLLYCPCHEGSFDLASGRPLAGPPRRPLARIYLEIRDGRIYAIDSEERTV
jgi:Rieske Fe-S protein